MVVGRTDLPGPLRLGWATWLVWPMEALQIDTRGDLHVLGWGFVLLPSAWLLPWVVHWPWRKKKNTRSRPEPKPKPWD